jgi:hypothetical protein
MFGGFPDAHAFAASLGRQIPAHHWEELAAAQPMGKGEGYWSMFAGFSGGGKPLWSGRLAVNRENPARRSTPPAVLLELTASMLHYGPPSQDTVNAQASQPSLAIRAAMLARQPEPLTLSMRACT